MISQFNEFKCQGSPTILYNGSQSKKHISVHDEKGLFWKIWTFTSNEINAQLVKECVYNRNYQSVRQCWSYGQTRWPVRGEGHYNIKGQYGRKDHKGPTQGRGEEEKEIRKKSTGKKSCFNAMDVFACNISVLI